MRRNIAAFNSALHLILQRETLNWCLAVPNSAKDEQGPMFDPTHTAESLTLEQEDCVVRQDRCETGTSFALPCSVGKLIRYFEVELQVNRGGVFLGFATEQVAKGFPYNGTLPRGIGSYADTWALDSYSGSIGNAGSWKTYLGRKLRPEDRIGCLLDMMAGSITFIADKTKGPIVPAFTGLDTSKRYYAATTLKYRKTQVFAQFAGPFIYWDTVQALVAQRYPIQVPQVLSMTTSHRTNRVLGTALLAARELQVAKQTYLINKQLSCLYQLPNEVLYRVAQFLEPKDLAMVSKASRLMCCISHHNNIWINHLPKVFRSAQPNRPAKAFKQPEAPPSNEFDDFASLPHSSMLQQFRVLQNWHAGRFNSRMNSRVNSSINSLKIYDDVVYFGGEEGVFTISPATQETIPFRNPLIRNVLRLDVDAEKVVAATEDGDLLIISTENGTLQSSVEAHKKDIEALALFRNTNHAVSGSWHKDIKVWDLEAEACTLNIVNAHEKAPTCLRYCGRPEIFASSSYDSTLKLWDTRVSGTEPVHLVTRIHGGSISTFTFSDDFSVLVSGGDDATIKFTDLKMISSAIHQAEPLFLSSKSIEALWLKQLRGHRDTITGLHFERGGRLISTSADKTIVLWNADRNKQILTLPMSGKVTCLDSTDEFLAVGADTGRTALFDFGALMSEDTEARRKFFLSRISDDE